MKVSVRLMLGFGVLCLFLIALGVFSLVTMKNVNVQTERIIDNWMPSVSKAYQIKMEVNRIYQLQGEIINSGNANLEEEMTEKKATLRALVEAYLAQSISVKGKDVANLFFMDFEGGEANDQQILQQVESGNAKGALLLYEGYARRLFEGMNKSLDALIAISEAEAGDAGQMNRKLYNQGFQIIIAAMGLIVILAIGLSLWTIHSILSPIRKINKILEGLAGARGDLTKRIQIQSGDEIEVMARNINQVLETVETMVMHIRLSTVEVAASSIRIEENCSQLANATEEISDAVTGLSEKSMEQTEKTQAARDLVHEYLGKLGNMADNAQETYELARNAQENTELGNEQMVALLNQMQAITEHNDAANISLTKFQKMLEQVGQVNQLIKSISEQTNILSLNAGIEAARAGAQGKGFGVIADEVRKLSQNTKESAQNIIDLLNGVQSEVENLTRQFHDNTENILEGSQQIRQLTGTFQVIKEMNGTVMRNGSLTRDDANGMLTTAEEIAEVFDLIGELSEEQSAVSQQISASVEEQLSSNQLIESFTKELSKQSDQLKQLVEKFQVTDANV